MACAEHRRHDGPSIIGDGGLTQIVNDLLDQLGAGTVEVRVLIYVTLQALLSNLRQIKVSHFSVCKARLSSP